MVAWLEQVAELFGLRLEVDPREGRIPLLTGTTSVNREASGPLRVPGHPSGGDAAVDEHDPWPAADDLDVHRAILDRRTKFV
jgi:hypothetical protein